MSRRLQRSADSPVQLYQECAKAKRVFDAWDDSHASSYASTIVSRQSAQVRQRCWLDAGRLSGFLRSRSFIAGQNCLESLRFLGILKFRQAMLSTDTLRMRLPGVRGCRITPRQFSPVKSARTGKLKVRALVDPGTACRAPTADGIEFAGLR